MSAPSPAASPVRAVDPELAELLAAEEVLQRETIRLIASENYVSSAVLAATGTVLTNKYSEGYPGKRYYEGQANIDRIEQLCIDRAKALFGADHANVQPYSGSPANLAVYLAFCKPGDTVMGLGLPAGGHLTHGWNVSISGQYFRAVQYGVAPDTPPHRSRRGARPGAQGATAPPVRRRHRDPAHDRLRGLRRDRPRGRRDLRRRHRPHRRAGRGRGPPVADRPRRRGVVDDPQDPARPARRPAPVQGRPRQGRSIARSSPACRAARTTTPPPAWRSRSRRRPPTSSVATPRRSSPTPGPWPRPWSSAASP
jgi:hypothetical protein